MVREGFGQRKDQISQAATFQSVQRLHSASGIILILAYSVLTQRFSNAVEYDLETIPLDSFIKSLKESNHFLIHSQTYAEEGTYFVAPDCLFREPDLIRRILTEAFTVGEASEDNRLLSSTGVLSAPYLLILSPRAPQNPQWWWTGRTLVLDLPHIDLDPKDNRARLVAAGPGNHLTAAKAEFESIPTLFGDDFKLIRKVDSLSNIPAVNRELRKISRATTRLAESIVKSVETVRTSMNISAECQSFIAKRDALERREMAEEQEFPDIRENLEIERKTLLEKQELLENWYQFASEHGQHAQKQRYMEPSSILRFSGLLVEHAISWVSFICDDCDPRNTKTFKWTVNALDFTLHRSGLNVLLLSNEQFTKLAHKVGKCISVLVVHFDILGARATLEAKREKERQEAMLREQVSDALTDEEERILTHDDGSPFFDPSMRTYWERVSQALRYREEMIAQAASNHQRQLGRVLDTEKLEDRTLVDLASSSSNIRWQQGRFIGAGAFGSVYLAVNLDLGTPMAVKEIKFQALSGLPSLYAQIKDELDVMKRLHHANVVEYYGIEVHRDRVYIFEEYCQGGSLAALLENGRIEDEGIMQVYTMQMLEGLAYLHANHIVHRDVKPDSEFYAAVLATANIWWCRYPP